MRTSPRIRRHGTPLGSGWSETESRSMGTAEGRACIGISMEMVGQGKVGLASFNNFCELLNYRSGI